MSGNSVSSVLLLLPLLQFPANFDLLKKTYGNAISQVLVQARPTHSQDISRVDIALLLDGGINISRAQLYAEFQSLVARLYVLVGSHAAQSNIDLDFPGGIDARIFAVDAPYGERVASSQDLSSAQYSGPLSDMRSFLESRSGYTKRYCVGPEILSQSCLQRLQATHIDNIPEMQILGDSSGSEISPDLLHNTVTKQSLNESASKTHFKVAVGGTFDHIHLGHKLLLTATVFIAQPGLESREITVGITGDELLVNKKHASVLESWDTRQKRVSDFVDSILVFDKSIETTRSIEHFNNPGPNGKAVKVTYTPRGSGLVSINYVQISDPFGPTITDESISALIISAETRAGGKAVNDKRSEKGWAPLEVFEVDVLDAGSSDTTQIPDSTAVKTTFESKISSTEIRRRLAAEQAKN